MSIISRGMRADLGVLGLTTTLGTVAAVTPRSAHGRILDLAERLDDRLRRERPIHRSDLTESEEMREAVLTHRRTFRRLRREEALCQGYGIYRRGWPADVRVTGMDHVHEAHAEGRGLVIWQMSFLDLTPLFAAMAEAGYPVTHLSSAFHRLSSKREISRRLIAPALVRGETRALGERLMIPPSGVAYLKRMRSIIEDDHGTVSIRGDFTSGQAGVTAPHLEHLMTFPTGAPTLAHLTGAPLVTAAVVRRGPLTHEVVIDEPISVSRQATRREFRHAAVEEYARRLDDRAREFRDSRPILPFIPSLDPTLQSKAPRPSA